MNEANSSKVILPTVGRQVHFHLAGVSFLSEWVRTPDNTYAATIAQVHSPRLVNLCVLDGRGVPYSMACIPLAQPDEERPFGNWCEWPAYQKGQPAKAEQLERQIAERAPTLNTPATPDQVNRLNEHVRMEREARHAPGRYEGGQEGPAESAHPAIAATHRLDDDGNPLVGGQSESTLSTVYQDHQYQARKRYEDELQPWQPAAPTIPQD